jgi:hypothetical protein
MLEVNALELALDFGELPPANHEKSITGIRPTAPTGR